MAKRFQFRLEALKKYRENRLLLARKELISMENRVHELNQALRRAFRERSELIANSGAESGLRLLYANLISGETARIRKLEVDITQAEAERDRHARWVTHLGRELKAIEKLEERKREAHEHEQRLMEKRSMDEWVSERWLHSPQAIAAAEERQEEEEVA